MEIKSIEEIANFLREQAELRALENDERSILEELADSLLEEVNELESTLKIMEVSSDEAARQIQTALDEIRKK